VARRSIEGAGEVGRAVAELVQEQARHNVAVLQALSRTVDWDGAAQVQSDFVRTSVERAAAFTRRYLEVVQMVVASATSTAREQARKAA
jgi:nucleoside-diphosphate-sugar epimerase